MSLKIKFAILLGLLGLAVVGSLGASLWSVTIQHTQLSSPLKSMSILLDGLNKVESELDRQDALLATAGAPGPDLPNEFLPAFSSGAPSAEKSEQFRVSTGATDSLLRDLEANDSYQARVGKSTSRNLRARVSDFNELGGRWFDHPDPTAGRVARRASKAAHNLIERIQSRVVEEQGKAAQFGDTVRDRLLLLLASALLAALLVGALALILVRRWVMRPVASLRTAALRIADGDFDHRLPVRGRDEIAQLSGEVNHMAGMVRTMLDERVERERLAAVGEMVKRLAHNLRNPLAGIRGLAELSRTEVGPGTDVYENQSRIILSVDRFEKWLADLLSAARPLSVNPESCQIHPFLLSVLEAHRPMAATKSVRLELDARDAPAHACFDPRHMEHALVAIVTNAIQASPTGALVRITVASMSKGNELEIRVSDQGPGVLNTLVDKIFGPYFTTKRDGNGIGLAIAQQVVRAHGGRITVENGLGPPDQGVLGLPGATFVIRIPAGGPGEGSEKVADIRHLGDLGGENSGHRRRREPPVLDRSDACQGRP